MQHRQVESLFQRIKASTGDEKIGLLGEVAEALTIHAALEEQYFYPFARQQGVAGLIDESFKDHAEVKQLLSEILRVKQTDPRLDELCGRLERMVTEHVSQEESALLPKVEAQANRDELVSMRDDMQQAIDSWRDRELLRMAEHQESPPPV
jgi:hemerythrin superfamily protein